MSEKLVTTDDLGDGIVVLTINRPKALNALNLDVLANLADSIEAERRRRSQVVILTGAGEKAFVAGADIALMRDFDRSEATQFARYGQRILNMLTLFHGVTIAAVNGFALGGGMELAMACDLILLDEKARLGQPEVNLGVDYFSRRPERNEAMSGLAEPAANNDGNVVCRGRGDRPSPRDEEVVGLGPHHRHDQG